MSIRDALLPQEERQHQIRILWVLSLLLLVFLLSLFLGRYPDPISRLHPICPKTRWPGAWCSTCGCLALLWP